MFLAKARLVLYGKCRIRKWTLKRNRFEIDIPLRTDKKSIWGLIGEVFEDIHRVGTQFAVAGLLADFSISGALAVFYNKVVAHSLFSLGKEILETPALLRDIIDVFISTLPLTVAILLITARPKEFLTPLPLGAAWALVLAVVLGDLFHLGVNPSGYRLDPNLPHSGIGFFLTLIKGFIDQYGFLVFMKSCGIGLVFGWRLRRLRTRASADE